MPAVYTAMLTDTLRQPCDAAPAFTASTLTENAFNACSGGTGGWLLTASVTISGALQDEQEYLWEKSEDGGSTWATIARNRSTSSGQFVGARIGSTDNGGTYRTATCRTRCHVVPLGGAAADACTTSAQSTELSRSGWDCLN